MAISAWLDALSIFAAAPMAATPPAIVQPSPGDVKYEAATAATDELIALMRERSASPDPVRALLADIWMQRHNVPAMTAITETVAEMKQATQYAGEIGAQSRKPQDQP